MQRVAPNPAQTRVPPNDPDSTLRLALLLVFPTIGLEQLLHTSNPGLTALPYAVLHWFSDSLLALPLALIAVWVGRRLATRLGLGAASLGDLVARAALIAILFALTLVPGAVLHDAADRLTHAHTTLAIHSHTPLAVPQATQTAAIDGAAVTSFVVHGLGDGFAGQAIGLPLMVLAMWEVRKQRDRGRAQRVWMSGQREG
jgi:hypothetical protein